MGTVPTSRMRFRTGALSMILGQKDRISGTNDPRSWSASFRSTTGTTQAPSPPGNQAASAMDRGARAPGPNPARHRLSQWSGCRAFGVGPGEDAMSVRIRIDLSYDGTAFSGWA